MRPVKRYCWTLIRKDRNRGLAETGQSGKYRSPQILPALGLPWPVQTARGSALGRSCARPEDADPPLLSRCAELCAGNWIPCSHFSILPARGVEGNNKGQTERGSGVLFRCKLLLAVQPGRGAGGRGRGERSRFISGNKSGEKKKKKRWRFP